MDPASSVFPLLILSASIFTHVAISKAKNAPKKQKDDKMVTNIYIPELEPCAAPPTGLGLGMEDPVVQYYLKSLHEDREWAELPSEVDSKDMGTPDEWVRRHPDLIRLTGRHPFNCEAPLPKLIEKGYITPHNLHYVRTHGATPRIKFSEHRVYVGGSVQNPITLTMADIMVLPKRSLPVTLVCCGNRRKEQNMIKQTIGFNWGAAGVSNGVWTGVPLRDILKLAGVDQAAEGMHVRFASQNELGGDKLPGGVYGTSVPLQKALDPAADILVAYMYNGQMLSVDHGFPLRLIIPGYIGGRMIKWLTNIDVQPIESQDYYHFFDNRVLPPHVDAETAKAEGWWFKPEYICNDLSINSAMSSPNHDEFLPISNQAEEEATYKLQGYAYTGGGRRITRVEVSFDSGAVWRLCDVKITERPTEYGKYWSWIFWEHLMPAKTFLGKTEVVLRAWDEGHNTQPDKPTWNLMGMLNNPWFRIKIHPIEMEGRSGVIFEHPTLAGNQNGGWMARMKGDPSLTAPIVHQPTIGYTPTPVVEEKKEPKVVAPIDTSKPSFTMEEVKAHRTAQSSWFVVNNKVYDGTVFLKDHPGGADSIILASGADATEEFEAIHSKKAWKMLDQYYIGELRASDPSGETAHGEDGASSVGTSEEETDELIALNPRKRLPFKLVVKEKLSPDSYRLRFALQSSKHILGLPIGQHMLFSAKVDNKMVMRAYTPTSSDYDVGYFDLVIKVYYSGVSKEFPEGGKMSQYLGAMQVGDDIEVKGPMGHVTYMSAGQLRLDDATYPVKKFSMLCGGTGITPIYQILCAVLRDPKDATELHLLYSNRREEDILLCPELDALLAAHPGRLKLHYTLTSPPPGWRHLTGRVDEAMVRQLLPPGSTDTFALMCGPPGLLDVCTAALASHGFDKLHCVYF